MDGFRDVLLNVWREACRHIELHESTGVVAGLLAKRLPLAQLLVRRFDAAHRAVDTVAAGQVDGRPFAGERRTEVTAGRWSRLMHWAARGEPLHAPEGRRTGEIGLLAPPEYEGDALAGPLVGPDGPAGALVMIAAHRKAFRAPEVELFRSLLEPFSVALENDRRLHELAALREAAEADRRSLLSRLGRQELNEAVVGAETGLRLVMERVELVAASDVPVLILGETGTGKEVVSRAIHQRSPRVHGPFIRVNCGAIPAELIDSQLFGHERGSFTGASETRAGWFERADGGTLFLDEMGELPLPAQVRLLRVLQDGFIERVGGGRPIRVDVRIIAATHRDLAGMVKAGAFREDLWYRINVFPILLPRLRERIDDVPALARHFAQRAATRFGLNYVEPTPADLSLLMSYSWPGNIRELGAVIDRAAILGGGRRLEVAAALGLNTTAASNAPAPAAPAASNAPAASTGESPATRPAGPSGAADGPAVDTLDVAMRRHIERALAATRGRIEGGRGAAALLGINPHTLRARMRKLGVDWDRFRD